MCTTQNKYANTGLCTISTGNGNLDGSGVLGTVLTGGHTGTRINQIIVKAQANVTEGMVRLFIDDGVNVMLIKEVLIPATVQSAVDKAFEAIIYDVITLEPGNILKASTQNSDTFNVVALADDWEQCECSASVSCSDLQLTANTAIGIVDTANSNLDGTGAISNIVSSPSGSPLDGGTTLNFVNIKATGNTSEGMVRLYIDDGTGGVYLFREVPIPATRQSDRQPAYRTLSNLQFNLQAGYSLKASTQVAERFNVMVDAIDFANCACPE